MVEDKWVKLYHVVERTSFSQTERYVHNFVNAGSHIATLQLLPQNTCVLLRPCNLLPLLLQRRFSEEAFPRTLHRILAQKVVYHVGVFPVKSISPLLLPSGRDAHPHSTRFFHRTNAAKISSRTSAFLFFSHSPFFQLQKQQSGSKLN